MKKGAWKKAIEQCMRNAGVYEEYYSAAIDTLSDILERRDMAIKQWRSEGSLLMVQKTSDRGAVNLSKNPLLTIIQECEKDALNYWGQLGLTPSGLKKVFSADKAQEQKSAGLTSLLRALANE